MNNLSIADRHLSDNASSISTETLMKWADAMDDVMKEVASSVDEGMEYREHNTTFYTFQKDLIGSLVSNSGDVIDVSLFLEPEKDGYFLLSVFAGYDEILIDKDKDEAEIESIIREFVPKVLSDIFH